MLAESQSTRQQAIIAVAPLRPPKEDSDDGTGNTKAVIVIDDKSKSSSDGLKKTLKTVANDAKEVLKVASGGKPSVNDINEWACGELLLPVDLVFDADACIQLRDWCESRKSPRQSSRARLQLRMRPTQALLKATSSLLKASAECAWNASRRSAHPTSRLR